MSRLPLNGVLDHGLPIALRRYRTDPVKAGIRGPLCRLFPCLRAYDCRVRIQAPQIPLGAPANIVGRPFPGLCPSSLFESRNRCSNRILFFEWNLPTFCPSAPVGLFAVLSVSEFRRRSIACELLFLGLFLVLELQTQVFPTPKRRSGAVQSPLFVRMVFRAS